MLAIATEFPAAGSYAKFRDCRVRIQQIHADGTRLITGRDKGRTIQTTVALDQLTAADDPEDLIELWTSARIASVAHPAWTPRADAWADFQNWHRRTYQREPRLGRDGFANRLTAKGFVKQQRTHKAGWAFTLHAPEPRA